MSSKTTDKTGKTDKTVPSDTPLRPVSVRRRAAARIGAVQVNFQQAFTLRDTALAVDDFLAHYAQDLTKELKIRKIDETHFQKLCLGLASEQDSLDEMIAQKLGSGWSLSRLGRADHSVLRAGVYELCHMPHVPAKAVISEYAAVADAFGCDVQFVNGVLDNIARTIRAVEMSKS